MTACPKCGAVLAGPEETCSCGQWLRRGEIEGRDVALISKKDAQHDPDSPEKILKSYGKWALMLPILVIAGVVGKDIVQASRNDSGAEARITGGEIEHLLSTYNSSLPARVDEFTVLERVSYGPRSTLQYHYDISESEPSPDDQAMLERIRVHHIEQYCTSEETRPLREKGLGIAQTYYRSKSQIGTATAMPLDCQ